MNINYSKNFTFTPLLLTHNSCSARFLPASCKAKPLQMVAFVDVPLICFRLHCWLAAGQERGVRKMSLNECASPTNRYPLSCGTLVECGIASQVLPSAVGMLSLPVLHTG